jgi:hypothetical protein
MKSELSLGLPRFGDTARENDTTVVLGQCDLEVLIDVVETNLAGMLVYGYDDREELTALKRCRSELRSARQPLAETACGRRLSRKSAATLYVGLSSQR